MHLHGGLFFVSTELCEVFEGKSYQTYERFWTLSY